MPVNITFDLAPKNSPSLIEHTFTISNSSELNHTFIFGDLRPGESYVARATVQTFDVVDAAIGNGRKRQVGLGSVDLGRSSERPLRQLWQIDEKFRGFRARKC